MKKVVSFAVFVILLAWTWNLVHSEALVSFETHSIIQQRLAEIIEQSVQKHRPNAKDFNLLRLWTETVNDNQIKAFFTYRFREGTAGATNSITEPTTEATTAPTSVSPSEETISGEAVLKKTAGESANQENWRVERVRTSSNQVVFEEGTVVNTDDSAPSTDPNTQAPNENENKQENQTPGH
jgi:hypothetical protein